MFSTLRAYNSWFCHSALFSTLPSNWLCHPGFLHAPTTACQHIADAVSPASAVYYHGSIQYSNDNHHWASSSSQLSECSFEPATVEDVGIALRILGKTRTPFGIKSGGHATNAGFSSTPGVQIAMYSFSDIVYDADTQTVTLGTGLIWDEVYAALQRYGVTAVGAKATGVGVGGFVLGGGYSYLANQYGLTIDTVVAYELVLPNGTVADVTRSTHPDLFFGLRGGFNNFGVVTRVTVKTYPQSHVWGGLVTYSEHQWRAVKSAIADFWSNVSDPKATVDSSYSYRFGVTEVQIVLFYDAPNHPEGMFDRFLAIPHVDRDISTRSFSSFIRVVPSEWTAELRSVFHWAALEEITEPALQIVIDETMLRGEALARTSALAISYGVNPIWATLYEHSAAPSAYPPSRMKGYSFIQVFYGWADPSDDETMIDAVYASVKHVNEALEKQGQDVGHVAVYPNCAPPGMALERMYGGNVPRLRAIREAVDPDDVMGLTGGWKF